MLSSAIFRNSYTLSDTDISRSTTLSLITTDLETISTGLDILLDTIAYVIEITASAYIMWSLLGLVTITVLGLCTGMYLLLVIATVN